LFGDWTTSLPAGALGIPKGVWTESSHVCFNVADGFGDRAIATQIANFSGWETLKQRELDGIGESPTASFITQAEFFVCGDLERRRGGI